MRGFGGFLTFLIIFKLYNGGLERWAENPHVSNAETVVGHFDKTMKYKNYKSAIHNFTHSFMSIDYMKSGRLAVNVLIDLYKLKKETKATFNFINHTILPNDAESDESRQLLNNYLDWLPDHFDKHDCDISKLEELEITIWIDFDKAFSPPRMNDAIEFTINALTKWKSNNRDEQTIEISQTELIKKNYLKLRIPEIK